MFIYLFFLLLVKIYLFLSPLFLQVVQSLERIMGGETVIGIEDFSPAHSVSSMPESSGSQGDGETFAMGRLSTEESPTSRWLRTEASSIRSWSQTSEEVFSTSSSAKTFFSKSSITSKSSEGSIPSGNKIYKKKRPKSGTQVLYGEMLN